MHPPHRSVGVGGRGSSIMGLYAWPDETINDQLLAAPTQVVLVAEQPDADTQAAMALFEQAIADRSAMHCERVEIARLDAGLNAAGADSVVVFGRELQVLSAGTELAAVAPATAGSPAGCDRRVRVELAPAARWHPVLEGFEPFLSRLAAADVSPLPDDATVLLGGRSITAVEPVAWLRHGHGRAFYTRLRSVADFQQPAFLRLLLHAVAWVGDP
jgi:hypothetical protein